MTDYSVFTEQPKFCGCLQQMTCPSFVRIFIRLLLTSFENVLSSMCHHIHSVNNYFEAFNNFLEYISGAVHMKLVYI